MTTMIERRGKRTIFGKFVKYTFIVFNIFMALWMITGTWDAAQVITKATPGVAQTGGTVGLVFAWTVILFVWGFGDLILGLFLALTRSQKIIETIER
jgi:hypothetical protein